MFDLITKGEFKSKRRILEDVEYEHQVSCASLWIANVRGDNLNQAQQNAEFICFCFNLQQKYDIGLFEDSVMALEIANELLITHGVPCDFSGVLRKVKQTKK